MHHRLLTTTLCLLAISALQPFSPSALSSAAPTNLTVEHRIDPIGLDTPAPRFGWWLNDPRQNAVQTAYEIQIEPLDPTAPAGGTTSVSSVPTPAPQSGADSGATRPTSAIRNPHSAIFTTGKTPTSASVDVTPANFTPQPATRYHWRVRTWDTDDRPSDWSAPAIYETGLMHNAAWNDSAWIAHPPRDTKQSAPAAYLRTTFALDPAKPIARARLYATACGLFEAWINGRRVGMDWLTPGWTDYAKTNQYLTYDVTHMLNTRPSTSGRGVGGEGLPQANNCLGAILGDGWFAGFLKWGNPQIKSFYGPDTSLRMRLEIIHTDGTRVTIATGRNWRVTTGPIISSDIYNGEHYDARLELGPWSTPAYNASKWLPARVLGAATVNNNTPPPATELTHLGARVLTPADDTAKPDADGNLTYLGAHVLTGNVGEDITRARLVGKVSQPVRITQALAAKTITRSGPNSWIFDFGQNMVGVPFMKLAGRANQTVTIRTAEMLQDNGQLYTANYRKAKSTNTYTFARDGTVEWTPTFTFHGFRYLELSGPGLENQPPLDTLTGLVLHNDMPRTGDFTTSNPLVNQLQSNIVWGQRGNFLEVPTDCPQRDERLGWTGDAQVFARTATFNYDVRAFFAKWMADIRDAQLPNGGIPNHIPAIDTTRTSTAWGDAVTIIPWTLYEQYGDTRILADNYDAMKRWVEHHRQNSPDGLGPDAGYGDWLALDKPNPGTSRDGNTPKPLVSTAYYAHSAELTARAADILGHPAEAAALRALRDQARRAFADNFITPDGNVKGANQTGPLLALAFDLAPEHLRAKILDHLVADIRKRGWHLSTGFVGTALLMPTLSANGRHDIAYKLLLQETYPGWLYSIHQGATTMWERWNSYTKDKGFGPDSMNSFNHYAYGAVGEWMYATIGGLRAAEPGYKKSLIKPVPGGGLTRARCSLKTPYGILSSDWKIEGGFFELKTVVPPNTTAEVELPDGARHQTGSGARTWRAKMPPR